MSFSLRESLHMWHGLYATFMPKPREGVNGSGMHLNILAEDTDGKNLFYDEKDVLQLSETAYHFIAGVLEHMKQIIWNFAER